MPAAMAAAYVGEVSVAAFLEQVRRGTYPPPVVKQGRRQIWAKTDLDRAIQKTGVADTVDDVPDL
jgi:hypothetical protein